MLDYTRLDKTTLLYKLVDSSTVYELCMLSNVFVYINLGGYNYRCDFDFTTTISYWILAADSEQTIIQWYRDINPHTTKATTGGHFTPSTNPAMHPHQIGVTIPTGHERWSALHVSSVIKQ